MISGYFGVPGCGKTTILTSIAQKELRLLAKGKSCYEHVLTNFYCLGCEKVDFSDLGTYFISHSLILIDEVTLYADSRDFKAFSKNLRDFFTLHRHVFCDIIVFCQDYSRMDKTIRELAYDLWYVTKPVLPFFRNFSISRRIFRNISINEYTFLVIVFLSGWSVFFQKLFVLLGVRSGISISIALILAFCSYVRLFIIRSGKKKNLFHHRVGRFKRRLLNGVSCSKVGFYALGRSVDSSKRRRVIIAGIYVW